jgi:xanthine dehydrogenase accessory factor
MLDILETVEKWVVDNRKIALATVVKTWGSAPRREGSKMAVAPSDEIPDIIGSVSGGCIEGAVIDEATQALKTGQSKLLTFGVTDDEAWEVGLTCGGKISVFVEPLDAKWLGLVTEFIRQDRLARTVSVVDGVNAGQKLLLNADNDIQFSTTGWNGAQRETVIRAAQSARQSGQIDADDFSIMVDVHRPRPHLIVIGGVHVAMPLQKFAHELGFRVSLIDPRRAFATDERFPDVNAILHSYPDKALPQLGIDSETYITVLTHDPKIDDPALITALPSSAAYIGVLSSQRTHDKRLARLREAGVNEDHLARIHMPIGIEIGAQTPEEIALCIMSEIIAVRNGVIA